MSRSVIAIFILGAAYSCGARSRSSGAPIQPDTPVVEEATPSPTPTSTPSPLPRPTASATPEVEKPALIEATPDSIQKLLVNRQCINCHRDANPTNRMVDLTDILKIVAAPPAEGGVHHHEPNAPRTNLVIPGCPDQSIFLSIMREGKMPKAPAPKVSTQALEAVKQWIQSLNPNAGANYETGEPGTGGTVEPGEPD